MHKSSLSPPMHAIVRCGAPGRRPAEPPPATASRSAKRPSGVSALLSGCRDVPAVPRSVRCPRSLTEMAGTCPLGRPAPSSPRSNCSVALRCRRCRTSSTARARAGRGAHRRDAAAWEVTASATGSIPSSALSPWATSRDGWRLGIDEPPPGLSTYQHEAGPGRRRVPVGDRNLRGSTPDGAVGGYRQHVLHNRREPGCRRCARGRGGVGRNALRRVLAQDRT
jgi:hypothetical protein